MPFGGRGALDLADRLRATAARLRSVAALAVAPGDPISPVYVEELASELEDYADSLEPYGEDA